MKSRKHKPKYDEQYLQSLIEKYSENKRKILEEGDENSFEVWIKRLSADEYINFVRGRDEKKRKHKQKYNEKYIQSLRDKFKKRSQSQKVDMLQLLKTLRGRDSDDNQGGSR
jgi:hypothetical protein